MEVVGHCGSLVLEAQVNAKGSSKVLLLCFLERRRPDCAACHPTAPLEVVERGEQSLRLPV
jgi:hypothetical protein